MNAFLDISALDNSAFDGFMGALESTGKVDPLSFLLLNNASSAALSKDMNAARAAEKAAATAAEKAAKVAAAKARAAEMARFGYRLNPTKARFECVKCNGAGVIQHYRHVSGGACFNCDGAGHCA